MRRILLAFVLVGAVMSTGLLAGAALVDSAWAKGGNRYATLDTLALALHHIERHFISEPETQDLIYGGIKGMTRSLDPHSIFLTPEDMKRAEARTEGWYTGIGLELGATSGGARVTRVVPDGPADQAGILLGEKLLRIDGKSLAGVSLMDASAQLRGEEGTEVLLSLQDQVGADRDLRLRRVRVRDKAVRVLPGQPGFPVVRIGHFQRNTAADLETALGELAKRKGRTRGLVIDLRDNPGGLLDEAVKVVDLFLESGLIYESQGRDGEVVSRAEAKPGSRWEHTPLVVLVNGQSASASEIVAGALQAHGRAKLVGSPTFGKGSVQRMYIFEDGSALRLTVSRYHLAGDKVVADEKGLQPDVLVHAATEKSEAAKRLGSLVAKLPEADRAEARILIQTLQAEEDKTVPVQPDPQLEAAWKIVRATP